MNFGIQSTSQREVLTLREVASWREQVAEYEEMGKTDQYWKELAERGRHRMGALEGMLDWARTTSNAERARDIKLDID